MGLLVKPFSEYIYLRDIFSNISLWSFWVTSVHEEQDLKLSSQQLAFLIVICPSGVSWLKSVYVSLSGPNYVTWLVSGVLSAKLYSTSQLRAANCCSLSA